MRPKALIIGTGLGGLSTALRLTSIGYEVEMVEKYHQAGGRLNKLEKDGFTWDMAPTFFSMSYEFTELIKSCGIEQPFDFFELNPLYKVNFSNSPKTFTIYKDLDRLAQEFEGIEDDFALKMQEYLRKTGKLFHDTEGKIIRRNFKTLLQYALTLASVPMEHAPLMLRSMWSELDKRFNSYEVKVIFSLVAFFLGATPFDTPAVYSMLTYTELKHDGYHNVKGGMYRIVDGLMQVLTQRGVKFHFNTEIIDYKHINGEISGFIDKNGKEWNADVYIVNADAAWFRGAILKRKAYTEQKLDKLKWTLAPYTIYLGVNGNINNLSVHNYFLGTNFKEYSSKIFKNQISLQKPYYYVNTASKANPEFAPAGSESIFILCPVPDLRYKSNWDDSEQLADTIITDLSERIDYDIKSNLKAKVIYNPTHWQRMFNLYKGSGLGLAHDLNQIAYFRPHNTDEKFKNLFYVGSSTAPGTGLPMAVISSKLTTQQIVKRYGDR
ncbi:dehydrosqualene desaturase [Tenuifilaceae bacterium CYCD]|nr:dehydrosqualene desaturase [Tenuifilaceae bacterium CYCD]